MTWPVTGTHYGVVVKWLNPCREQSVAGVAEEPARLPSCVTGTVAGDDELLAAGGITGAGAIAGEP